MPGESDRAKKRSDEKDAKRESNAAGAKGRSFPAAPACKHANVTAGGVLELTLIADLGFRIYHEITITLHGVRHLFGSPGSRELIELFAAEWIKHGSPEPLSVYVLEFSDAISWATVHRVELNELGESQGLGSLAAALVEQGLAEWTC